MDVGAISSWVAVGVAVLLVYVREWLSARNALKTSRNLAKLSVRYIAKLPDLLANNEPVDDIALKICVRAVEDIKLGAILPAKLVAHFATILNMTWRMEELVKDREKSLDKKLDNARYIKDQAETAMRAIDSHLKSRFINFGSDDMVT